MKMFVMLFLVACGVGLTGCIGPSESYINLMKARQGLRDQFELNRQREIRQAADQFTRGEITRDQFSQRLQEIERLWGPAEAQSDIDEIHRLSTENLSGAQTTTIPPPAVPLPPINSSGVPSSNTIAPSTPSATNQPEGYAPPTASSPPVQNRTPAERLRDCMWVHDCSGVGGTVQSGEK